MAGDLSWTLVVESLINVKEIDVITLINVFKRSPKINSDVESNAREMISFKILERLFDLDTRPIKSAHCVQNSVVSFDYSKRCEDVLQHILGKMNDPNIWDESEKSKWNVKSFIAYKRRLTDTHVEGKTSYLTSLKHVVTSRKLNQDGTKICDVNGANISNQQQNPCIDDKDTSNEGNRSTRSGALNGEDGDKMCQNTSNEGNRNTKTRDLCGKDGDKMCQDTFNDGNRSKRTRTLNIEDGDNVEHSFKSQSLSDDESYQKEFNEIDSRKQVFFSSNCNKEGFTHSKDANCCMKCKKGGRLLICSSNACSFVFHESCLVSTTNTTLGYDSSGKFYCLFCKCSQSISEYWVAKKKTSLSRNHLASFSKGDNKNIEWQIPNIVLDPDLINELTEISGKKGCNERNPEKERADHMDCSSKFQKPNKSFTDLFFPERRRVPVPWMQSEEETLKKWVEKFKSCNGIQERGFPWSKILELGASKFQKSRTPVDLKDKWRNMQKASNKNLG